MKDLIGRDIGPFRVVRSLEGGAAGSLYEARDAQDLPVRLRILPRIEGTGARLSAQPDFTTLEHAHILGVLDSGHVNGFAYIATPLEPGTTLENRRGGSPLDLRELGALARQLADALDHAHSQGIVHGNLSPASIQLDEQGKPRITDFGVGHFSDAASRLSWAHELDGVLLYQAPEQSLGHPATAASDVYSLAAVLFELVTGEPPFRADTPVLLAMKHASEAVPSVLAKRPELGEATNLVLAQALAKRPDQRFGSAGAFVAALDAALASVDVRSVSPSVALDVSRGRLPRWFPPVALALFIWSTLPVMPTLRRVVISLAGDWVITVFGSVFFAVLGMEAVRRIVWTMRLREEIYYWRLFGVISAYALALLIYGHEPIEQVHLIYYGALGVLIFRAISPPELPLRAHAYAVILVWGLGWIDEGIQYLLNVHHESVTEWLAGIFGTTREIVAGYFHKRYYDLRDVRLNATAGMLGQFALAWWRSLPRR